MKGFENFWAKKQGEDISKKEIKEGLNEHHSGDDLDDHIDIKDENEEPVQEESDNSYEEIPKGLVDATNFMEINSSEKIDEIYEWYKKSMERKLESHGRIALEKERFISHFFEGGSFDGSFMYGDMERGFLLGGIKYGVFVPTHFAPKSLRKGYELIKDLGNDKNIPAAIAITDDLAEMIKRLPEWELMNTDFLAEFRGETVKKQIAHNKNYKIQQLLTGLLDEYIEEQRYYYDEDEMSA